jgi:hypothetical protein
MNTRALVVFLAINGVISVAIGYKFFYKPQSSTPIVQEKSIDFKSNHNSTNLDNNKSANTQITTNTVPTNQLAKISPSHTLVNNTNNSTNVEVNNNIPVTNPSLVKNSLVNPNQPINNMAISENKGSTILSNNLVKNINPIVNNQEHICTEIGPMDFNAKNSMEVIIKKDPQYTNIQYSFEEKPVYEIYWNLGNNREQAQEMFQKQKQNGTLTDSRFVMVLNEDKDWIVPITEVNISLEYAKEMANKLASAANKTNAGGKWNYQTKPTAYFYKISNFDILDIKTKKSIDMMINSSKYPCS